MRDLVLLVAALGLALDPATALAGGTCSSSSSSSSSGDSSSSSGSSGGSSGGGSSEPAQPACVDASPVVGIAECRAFGDGWDASDRGRTMVDIEVGAESFDGRDLDLPGTAVHEENRFDYEVDGVGRRVLGGFRFRLATHVSRHVYLGAGFAFHHGSLSGERRAGPLAVSLRSVTTADLVVVAGASFGLGRLVLRPEIEAGARLTSIGVTTRHFDCVLDENLTSWRPVAKARLVLDLFHRPRAAFGVYAGFDTVAQEASAGARWSFHSRAHDGLIDRLTR